MDETKCLQHFHSMAGMTYELGLLKLAFKRTQGEGEGSYSVFELIEPPGSTVALHRHPPFQETFVVCEGRFDFEVSGERRSLGPGEMLIIPRGATHGFTCTSPEAGRLLVISTPAGLFEAFVADVCSAGLGGTGDISAIAARHGLEFF